MDLTAAVEAAHERYRARRPRSEVLHGRASAARRCGRRSSTGRPGTLSHGGTFNNNVISMAGGVAALSEILTATVLDELFDRGERLRARLVALTSDSPLPLCVTGWGSMLTIHTVEGPVSSPHDVAAADGLLKQLLFHELLHRGFYVAPRGFVALSLAVTDDDLDRFVDAFAEALDAMGRPVDVDQGQG